LKLESIRKWKPERPSPPVRGRGLKRYYGPRPPPHIKSPPVRGRGLKLSHQCHNFLLRRVAPRAGARIETARTLGLKTIWWVAPRAGARIETCQCWLWSMRSPVAPRAGARIETLCR